MLFRPGCIFLVRMPPHILRGSGARRLYLSEAFPDRQYSIHSAFHHFISDKTMEILLLIIS